MTIDFKMNSVDAARGRVSSLASNTVLTEHYPVLPSMDEIG